MILGRRFHKANQGVSQKDIKTATCDFKPSVWHDVVIKATGANIEISVDGASVLTATDPEPLSAGMVAFGVIKDSGAVDYDAATLTLGKATASNGKTPPSTGAAPPSTTTPKDTGKSATSSIGMKLVLIPAGEFSMGSPASDTLAGDKEKPQHKVTLTKPFYLGAYEVTQAEYQKVMGENPSYFCATGQGKDKTAGMDTSQYPVEMVSWHRAVEFCNDLSEKEGLSTYYEVKRQPTTYNGKPYTETQVTIKGGTDYRLPTEAEWEYACRRAPQHFGTSGTILHRSLTTLGLKVPRPNL